MIAANTEQEQTTSFLTDEDYLQAHKERWSEKYHGNTSCTVAEIVSIPTTQQAARYYSKRNNNKQRNEKEANQPFSYGIYEAGQTDWSVINRPGIAGAVLRLQTLLSLTD